MTPPAPTQGLEAGDTDGQYTTVPTIRLRRVTAKRMRASVADKPQVTLHRYARAEALVARQHSERAVAGKDERATITLTTLLVAIVGRVSAANPRLNGRVEDGEIRLYRDVNVSVAVEVPGGLAVPVIRHADRRSVLEIGADLRRLSTAAKENALRIEDVTDSTFTISNLGSYGVDLFTPIISPPELGILGVGAIGVGVEVVEGVVTPVRRIGLSLTFDHAASDGSDAAKLLGDIVTAVEDPSRALGAAGA